MPAPYYPDLQGRPTARLQRAADVPAKMDLLPENKLRRGLAPLALTALLATLILAASSPAPAPAQDPVPLPPKPNIVLVMTDDQAAHTLTPSSMPTVHKVLMAQGTNFTDHVVTTPLCC